MASSMATPVSVLTPGITCWASSKASPAGSGSSDRGGGRPAARAASRCAPGCGAGQGGTTGSGGGFFAAAIDLRASASSLASARVAGSLSSRRSTASASLPGNVGTGP